MQYGGVSQDEMEVTIRLDRTHRQAHICSTWPEWSRKLERIFGSPRKEIERDGKVVSAFWTVPLNRVALRRGPRVLTAEQRKAAVERLRMGRQINSMPSSPL